MRSNVLGVMNVIDCCYLQDIHVTHFGSACIFDQDDAHPVEGSGFTEEDEPNWVGSWYSRSRNVSEKVGKDTRTGCIEVLTVTGYQPLS